MKLEFCKRCAPSHCTDKRPCHKQTQLIYGPVYLNCDRLKKNGLQNECKRKQCINNPDCSRRKSTQNLHVCCENLTGI